ncbi:hypothetical protein NMG60_11016551 [Bertholletia excelsa]
MSKLTTTLFAIALLSLVLTHAASRSEPSKVEILRGDAEAASNRVAASESCEGLNAEECLVRRTLAAHVDYIYTQNKKDKP